MSRRVPTRVRPHRAGSPHIWRSLEDRARSPEARKKIAETEFVEGQTGVPVSPSSADGALATGAAVPKIETHQPPPREPGAGDGRLAASQWVPAASLVSRRGFIQLSTASAAAVGLGACIRRDEAHIVPYGVAPEHVIPGVPLHYASVTERRGDALGVLVTTHEGRPTKIEGNPQHPRSLGATDVWAQAALMDLYDPDRARTPTSADHRASDARVERDWDEFRAALDARLRAHGGDQGRGLRFLLPVSTSPSLRRAVAALQQRFPAASIHRHEPLPYENLIEGVALAFGVRAMPVGLYHAARTILALDCDFLGSEPAAVRSTQLFASHRRPDRADLAKPTMNRLYVVEPGFSTTGSVADHRLPLPAQDIGAFLCALADDLAKHFDIDLGPIADAVRTQAAAANGLAVPPRWFSEQVGEARKGLAADLAERRGQSLIAVGSRQPPAVHALAHALNNALGAIHRTITFAPLAEVPEGPKQDSQDSLADLTAALAAGEVTTLVTLGTNPVLTAPADLRFGEALQKAEHVFALSTHLDETARFAHWHCPEAHELESWGDARGLDGSFALRQPTIQPLWHGARSVLELVAYAAGDPNWRGYSQVRTTFRETVGDGDQRFRSALHRGLAGDTSQPVQVSLLPETIAGAVGALPAPGKLGEDRLEINFVPCGKLLDGRYANNIWLQELPDTMTKLVWDNALLMGPKTAAALRVADGDLVRLSRGNLRLEAIVVAVLPGLPAWSLTVALGHGRGLEAGRYAHGDDFHGGGFNAYPLRGQDALWFANDVRLERLGQRYFLARTQDHGLMSGLSHEEPRAIVLSADVTAYEKTPNFAAYEAVEMTQQDPANPKVPPPGGPLWRPVDYSTGHKWGMTIDLSACTGCNACVVACQAENNIPCVGKRQVARGREMYWLRIDRYFVGDDVDNPRIALQPVGCQHCEEAPCENVCPVNATVHSPEGMNDMAYNRCIGTRYCANNCPYKVRRFNYLAWHGYVNDRFANYADVPETQKMVYNPNVTVRMRGVMEKCSYCVQRVSEAKMRAKRALHERPPPEGMARDDASLAAVRELLDRGELQSACQQVCPAGAIRFGDLNDDTSELAKLAAADRSYHLLAELGTRPRTTFLAQIRNPNPDMDERAGGVRDVVDGHARGAAGVPHDQAEASRQEGVS